MSGKIIISFHAFIEGDKSRGIDWVSGEIESVGFFGCFRGCRSIWRSCLTSVNKCWTDLCVCVCVIGFCGVLVFGLSWYMMCVLCKVFVIEFSMKNAKKFGLFVKFK